jgi:carotenoid 1,2-hydratase
VFSPYYARARQRGDADPLQHCALNVALYSNGRKRWALTERNKRAVVRSASTLSIGPSALHWDGEALTIDIDEMTFPLPSSIRGQVRVRPTVLTTHTVALDDEGLHHWSPLAPSSRVEVELTQPGMRWQGRGYLDSNRGAVPLEDSFTQWHWSRAAIGDDTVVLYDVTRRSGTPLALATRFRANGEVETLPPVHTAHLPHTGWRIARATRSDLGHPAHVLRTLEDTPFYARSLVSTHVDGAAVTAMHESLSLERFRTRWVRTLLPFRMPRVTR